jgi:two-component system, OmpR family, osmolarity sensor histidine kinase EnvZ
VKKETLSNIFKFVIWLFAKIARVYAWALHSIVTFMPKGLYARSLIIIILPMIILQGLVAYFFMERHWRNVTGRLSQAVVSELGTIIDVYQNDPRHNSGTIIANIAQERFGHNVSFVAHEPLPQANRPKMLFGFFDKILAREMLRQIKKPFWIDTHSNDNLIEIRIDLGDKIMRVVTRRSLAYASNAHIFLVWMLGSSLVLILIAVLFLRNQIRPIVRLSEAAESFGKGRDIDFRPRGAREVRQAGRAFIEMKRRIERSVEQRTAMLNGVSHDLRTVLTRFRLSVEMMEDSPDKDPMLKDVGEMSRMLEAYLAFARGDASESAVATDLPALMSEIQQAEERQGHDVSLSFSGEQIVTIMPDAFRRLLSNLVANASRYGTKVNMIGVHDARWLTVHVDDNGPGIAAQNRMEVFKPFVRLDEARTLNGTKHLDESGTGLGLSIARDIARSHGGDIVLSESESGGLRASVRVPV